MNVKYNKIGEIKEDYINPEKKMNSNINKRKIIFVVCFVLFAIILVSSLFYLFEYLNRYNGPSIENLEFNSIDGPANYTGEINNKIIEGNGILTIETETGFIEYNGLFENNENLISNGEIIVSDFKEGVITYKDGINKYIYTGTFEDKYLIKGTIKKDFNRNIVIETGSFINHKLTGYGTRNITIDGKSEEITGIFVEGILKSKDL